MKKKRISELNTDELIEHLKSKIERLAPSDPEHKEGREEFYRRLNAVPKEKQRNILLEIFSSQIASDLTPKTEKAQKEQKEIEKFEKEEAKEREKARKRYEYIQRCYARGKVPKVKPPDPLLLASALPPHRKKDIAILNLWDIYVVLKKAKLSPVYENLKSILNHFLHEFMELNSIKRELRRIKKDPDTREYVEFKIRSKKPHK